MALTKLLESAHSLSASYHVNNDGLEPLRQKASTSDSQGTTRWLNPLPLSNTWTKGTREIDASPYPLPSLSLNTGMGMALT